MFSYIVGQGNLLNNCVVHIDYYSNRSVGSSGVSFSDLLVLQRIEPDFYS